MIIPITSKCGESINLSVADSTMAAIERSIENGTDMCVEMSGYTQPVLAAAFSLVQNKEYWKYPVRVNVPASLVDEKLIQAAIVHYHGCEPKTVKFEDIGGGLISITAPGYQCW